MGTQIRRHAGLQSVKARAPWSSALSLIVAAWRVGGALRAMWFHPGLTATNLLAAHPEMGRDGDTVMVRMIRRLSHGGVLAQTVEGGLLPALYAATSPQAKGGLFYGPGGIAHLAGAPAEQKIYQSATSEADATRLWGLSEQLAGVRFPAVANDLGRRATTHFERTGISMTDFTNRVALVTGSARGIGKAIALRYASLGAKVVLNYAGDEANARADARRGPRPRGRRSRDSG